MQVQISRSQTSTIQDIIYPKTFKPNKESHKKNLYLIRKKQEENRQKKFEKENYIERK
ncbi:MAG: hypothetical protein MJ252_03785 [archaeon]|nr:hypothetical protein [archaeon]